MLERVPCADITRLGLSADGTNILPLAGQGIQFHIRSQNLVLSGWLRLKKEKRKSLFSVSTEFNITSNCKYLLCQSLDSELPRGLK